MQHVADIIPIMRHQPQISHPTAKFREDISFKLLNVLYLSREDKANVIWQITKSEKRTALSSVGSHSLQLVAAGACCILNVSSPWCGQQARMSLGHDWVETGSRHTATTTLILVTVAVAVVFNGGTRGCNLAYAWQESATANEKAIWEELAYWHQAWRQEKAVRSETPNDGSSWTAAHYSKSFFLSLINVTVLRYLMFFSLHLLH